jgi:hypothetical protein
VDEDQGKLAAQEGITRQQAIDDTDARLIARLTQVLNTPGISDKDRKLVERNLQRLRAALKPG